MLRQILKLQSFQATVNSISLLTNSRLKVPQVRQFHASKALAATSHKAAVENNTERENEKEFLVKLKDDPDTFGGADLESELEPGDKQEQTLISEVPQGQKLHTKQYADIIKAFIRKRKIKEAIDVLEVRMLKDDRVKPENYIFNLIIGACGRVGYTKKAFSLYNDMKRRALTITPGTYTALFNACANSPWPTTDGLSRSKHLRSIMIEKMYEPNDTNYNAMIKAFGRGGDLETAFALVDEMSAKKFKIKDDTLNFLLQACISDKEAGFRHALLIWRKFVEKRIPPSTYSYNLMLRCIRDCGLDDVEVTIDVINRLVLNQTLALPELDQKLIGTSETPQNALTLINKPDLMAKVPRLGNIVSLSEVTRPEDRLLLVGGCNGFLENMIENKCRPNIKTFTQLLDNIPGTLAAEQELMLTLKKHKVKPDLDFYNMLIKKRSTRFDYECAREVLKTILERGFIPNLITYGVLAIGCKTKEEAEAHLEEMTQAGFRINIEILGAMLTQACHHNNFPYVLYIMELCCVEQIQPSKKFLGKLEGFKKKTKSISNDQGNALANSIKFQKGHKGFRMRYKTWLEEVKVEEEVHPWQQYRQPAETDVKHYKDKQQKTRFKPIHTHLYKQKPIIRDFNKN